MWTWFELSVHIFFASNTNNDESRSRLTNRQKQKKILQMIHWCESWVNFFCGRLNTKTDTNAHTHQHTHREYGCVCVCVGVQKEGSIYTRWYLEVGFSESSRTERVWAALRHVPSEHSQGAVEQSWGTATIIRHNQGFQSKWIIVSSQAMHHN